jgi:hypothetical protein
LDFAIRHPAGCQTNRSLFFAGRRNPFGFPCFGRAILTKLARGIFVAPAKPQAMKDFAHVWFGRVELNALSTKDQK